MNSQMKKSVEELPAGVLSAEAGGSSSLCHVTAVDALAMFRRRELSPVELAEAVISQAERVNPSLNAFTYTFFDRALKQAREAERRHAAGEARPFEGILLAVKDTHAVNGEITTMGSRIFEGVESDYTVPIVQRMVDAGAIIHARTTSPEFAHTGHCHSPLWGTTRNPWNLDYSPGGSSGGSAAAVASGMTTIATGDDGGGSIRIPSSACGVFGFKPPFGRNPTLIFKETAIESIIHLGAIARSVGDAALVQDVISGAHPDDLPSHLPPTTVSADVRSVDPSTFSIGYSPDLGYFEVDEEVQAQTRRAADRLRDMGCNVEEVELDWDNSAYDAWVTHWEALFASIAGDHLPRWQYDMDPFVRGILQRGMSLGAVRAKRTEFVRTEMWRQLSPIMQRHQFLICPTLSVPSVRADHRSDDENFRVNGKRVDAHMAWTLTYPFNLLSQLPVASVPTGFAQSGVPTGMQIVGRPYADASVFELALAYEQAYPWGANHPAL